MDHFSEIYSTYVIHEQSSKYHQWLHSLAATTQIQIPRVEELPYPRSESPLCNSTGPHALSSISHRRWAAGRENFPAEPDQLHNFSRPCNCIDRKWTFIHVMEGRWLYHSHIIIDFPVSRKEDWKEKNDLWIQWECIGEGFPSTLTCERDPLNEVCPIWSTARVTQWSLSGTC